MKKFKSPIVDFIGAGLLLIVMIVCLFVPMIKTGLGSPTLINMVDGMSPNMGNLQSRVATFVIVFTSIFAVLLATLGVLKMIFKDNLKGTEMISLVFGCFIILTIGVPMIFLPAMMVSEFGIDGTTPGVLSSADYAFGCIIYGCIAALTGISQIALSLPTCLKGNHNSKMLFISIALVIATYALLFTASSYVITGGKTVFLSFYESAVSGTGSNTRVNNGIMAIFVILCISLIINLVTYVLDAYEIKSPSLVRSLVGLSGLCILTASILCFCGTPMTLNYRPSNYAFAKVNFGYGTILTGVCSLASIAPLVLIFLKNKPVEE